MHSSTEDGVAPTLPYPGYGPGYGPQEWPPYRTSPEPRAVAKPSASKPKAFRPLELGIVAALAIGVDVTLWHNGPAGGGYGLAIFFSLVLAATFAAAKPRVLTPRLAVLECLGALVALRCAFEPTFTAVLSGLVLMGVIAIALRRRNLSVPDAVLSALRNTTALPSRVGAALRGARAISGRARFGKVSLLPIAIPAGLAAAFLGVFALANPVVAHGVSVAATTIANHIPFPSFGRIFLWVGAAAAATLLLRPAIWFSKGTEAAKTETEATPTALLVARNAMVCLNVMFAGYNALDARYLFTGAPPAGMRTQDYAHQGAFWLTVALALLTAVIGVMFKGPLAHDARAKTTRWLAYAWMLQGLGLAAGSYRRIAMHISYSGLSDLRIVGILGTTVVISGVILVALKLKNQRTFLWLLRRQLDAFALTVVCYALAPTHFVSARVNVQRIDAGEYRPLLHTFAQSKHAESAPNLLPLLQHDDVRIRRGVAALLLDERDTLREDASTNPSWRERNVAATRALAALDDNADTMRRELGATTRATARDVLLDLARAADEGQSVEELRAIGR